MGVAWTSDQQKVISLRNRNILVSAAAGSGKTAVLVERIITMITDDKAPVDIDSLLIVTFTNAAAAEMRERIRLAIEKKLEEEPDNDHLIRQSTLVHNAMITTIHSFCLDMIRNHFHVIDLDPNFRIADEGELKLLKADTVEQLLEDYYEEGKESFYHFIECYSAGKNDEDMEQLILKLYEFSMSDPWPKRWLLDTKKQYEAETKEELFQKSWMQAAQETIGQQLLDLEQEAKAALALVESEDGPYMYENAVASDLHLIEALRAETDYEKQYIHFQNLNFQRLSAKKDETVSEQKKDLVKGMRDKIKKTLGKIKETYFYQSPDRVLSLLQKSKPAVEMLAELTIAFLERFAQAKKEKNLLDFHDLEHYALKILVNGEGESAKPSDTASQIQKHYHEILIDEYQDSNLVQEMILTSIAGGGNGKNNVFMVGDVKQSIYKFRMARPELFMKKYETYTLEDSEKQRIDLHQNFRSRNQVLSSVNFLFEQIMAKCLGNIEYDDSCALHPGAVFAECDDKEQFQTELLVIDSKEIEIKDGFEVTKRELEAKVIAKRIKELVKEENGAVIWDKQEERYRTPRYSDIVILLRTISGWAEEFSTVFMAEGIPAHTGSQTGYFSTIEIQTILNVLRTIDNPLQDIPFAAVLHSPVGKLSAEELAELKRSYADCSMYEAAKQYANEGRRVSCKEKCCVFLEFLSKFRIKSHYTPIHSLIWEILDVTGYDLYTNAMPAGEQRKANIEMLVEKAIAFEATSYKGLYHFIQYIENLQKYDVDFGEAETINEADNTVRIISIHKSKGLEFSICFVSGMGKIFNNQDARSKIVLHPDMGIGADYIDPDARIRTQTLMKKIMKQQMVLENLGEELRVLYVALTRAKEKLIITGDMKNIDKKVASLLQIRNAREKQLSFSELSSVQSNFDWLLKAMMRHPAIQPLFDQFQINGAGSHLPEGDQVPITIHYKSLEDILQEEIKTQTIDRMTKEALLKGLLDPAREEWDAVLEQNLEFIYLFETETKLHTKVSISELKKAGQEFFEPEAVEIPEIVKKKIEKFEPTVPKFISKEEEMSGASRGTAYHKILQRLDFIHTDKYADLEKQVQEWMEIGILTEDVKNAISLRKVFRFLQGRLAGEMKEAAKKQQLYKERQFVMGLPAREIRPEYESDELMLIQGIIDVYYEREDGLILVDYKTDRVGSSKELLNRYRVQLDYYAKALEQITGKKVREKWIYSFALQKEIPC